MPETPAPICPQCGHPVDTAQAHVVDADGRIWHPGEAGCYSAARDEAARGEGDAA